MICMIIIIINCRFFSHVINCIIFDALAILFREGDREGREGGGGTKVP